MHTSTLPEAVYVTTVSLIIIIIIIYVLFTYFTVFIRVFQLEWQLHFPTVETIKILSYLSFWSITAPQ